MVTLGFSASILVDDLVHDADTGRPRLLPAIDASYESSRYRLFVGLLRCSTEIAWRSVLQPVMIDEPS